MKKNFYNSILEGKEAENRFKSVTKNAGFTCVEKTDIKSQCLDHVDFQLIGKKTSALVDVKAMKRVSRGDKTPNFEKIWLEFKNVSGKKGWLYGGADYIAFETPKSFSFIKRDSLVKWAEDNIDLDNIVDSAKMAYKKGYTREGRKDLISFVNLSEISHLIEFNIGENGLKKGKI